LNFIAQRSGKGEVWIVCYHWWNYWPIRYLALTQPRIHVRRTAEMDHPDCRDALAQGRMWFVEFEDTDEQRQMESRLAGRRVDRQTFPDFSGRPLLCAVHPAAE
jgi:hypothetical protein